MTLAVNIVGLLLLAGLIGISLRLGRRPRETASRAGRSPDKDMAVGTAKRPR